MTQIKSRDIWVDYVKVIACIFVVLGHFFQSMVSANLIPLDNTLYLWFIKTIYYFHVPLFFICSGYLYQKYSKIFSINSYCLNIANKFIALGVPYFTFSIITYFLKVMFSGSVNNVVQTNIFETLFLEPLSPYWYLYILFFLFLITPTFKKKTSFQFLLFLTAIVKLILPFIFSIIIFPYCISKTLNFCFWFILGMYISFSSFDIKFQQLQNIKKKKLICVLSVLCIILIFTSVLVPLNEKFDLSFIMGLLFCMVICLLNIVIFDIDKQSKILNNISNYTLPIFLMHTIFASTFRTVLFKAGIGNLTIHCFVGIGISFIGPILVAILMKKSKWFEFFLYPTKFVKIRRNI